MRKHAWHGYYVTCFCKTALRKGFFWDGRSFGSIFKQKYKSAFSEFQKTGSFSCKPMKSWYLLRPDRVVDLRTRSDCYGNMATQVAVTISAASGSMTSPFVGGEVNSAHRLAVGGFQKESMNPMPKLSASNHDRGGVLSARYSSRGRDLRLDSR